MNEKYSPKVGDIVKFCDPKTNYGYDVIWDGHRWARLEGGPADEQNGNVACEACDNLPPSHKL